MLSNKEDIFILLFRSWVFDDAQRVSNPLSSALKGTSSKHGLCELLAKSII